MSAKHACGFSGGQVSGNSESGVVREIIRNVRQIRADLMRENPLQAIALNPLIDAATEIRQARKALKLVIRQNQENARNRAKAEKERGRSGLESRLLKDPAAALAEAESTRQGLLHLIEMWRSLGAALLEKDGLNEEEYHMACRLLGAPNLKLRTSKARLAFDRAIKADRDRKFQVIFDRSQMYMDIYIKRLADETWRSFIVENDMEASIIDAFMKRYKDWVQYLLAQLEEEEEFYRQWCERPPIHRDYWKSTRKIVATVILKYRARLKSVSVTDEKDLCGEWTPQENRKVENARKVVNTALANFQKGVNTAKNAGLFIPVKPAKKTVGKLDESCAEMNEVQIEKASVKSKRGQRAKHANENDITKHPLKCNPASTDCISELFAPNEPERNSAMTTKPHKKRKPAPQPSPDFIGDPPRNEQETEHDESS